ncbi:hypothetical protein N7510_011853 [Penicillium lagena]|uniref:uncharacterized protein n=1 Tax=Penicillium lagena TaxID=94218 RepID=UPI00254045AA|nr:uncharacterized protein N7510_011853 [Penicillium lagena]KAJ5598903.1 hypothetical protein N7510_011853 [Penicillium lagena]
MANSEEVSILAIISPKPDRIDQVLELIKDPLVAGVKAIEPGCISFHANRATEEHTDEEEIFMIERFVNSDAIAFHQKNPAFLAFARALEEKELLQKPLYIKIVKPVAGFVRN